MLVLQSSLFKYCILESLESVACMGSLNSFVLEVLMKLEIANEKSFLLQCGHML